jgi:CO dehydrogenase/acetyl-CoA synthase epsilon subunit
MGKLKKKLVSKGSNAARKAYEKVETRVLVAAGRRAVRRKAQTVAKVSKRAMKAGLIVGAVAAAEVVVREVLKRRRSD